jgi:hypothetical protein
MLKKKAALTEKHDSLILLKNKKCVKSLIVISFFIHEMRSNSHHITDELMQGGREKHSKKQRNINMYVLTNSGSVMSAVSGKIKQFLRVLTKWY